MVIFFRSGSLGNQIFQYYGIRSNFPEERVWMIGCNNLHDALDGIIAYCPMMRGAFKERVRDLFKWSLNKAADYRLICVTEEVRKDGRYFLVRRKGVISSVTLVRRVFFQHRSVLPQSKPHFEVKPSRVIDAQRVLKKLGLFAHLENLYFVHVRRGDYLRWPSRSAPAVLPASWYVNCMQKIRQKNADARFIFLTNDPFYVTETIGVYQKIIICAESESVDFAIMSLCAGGVLSASTYSWWGGFLSFAGNCHKEDKKIFLAPTYWGGIRKKEWWPSGFVSDWLAYIPVETDASLSMDHVTDGGA